MSRLPEIEALLPALSAVEKAQLLYDLVGAINARYMTAKRTQDVSGEAARIAGTAVMQDLRIRMTTLMHEIEYIHLKTDWAERIIAGGVDERDAYKWVAEIGHVVDEYERSLRFLCALLETSDATSAAQELESWVAYTHDMSAWKLENSTTELINKGNYQKYLPPEPEDEGEEID